MVGTEETVPGRTQVNRRYQDNPGQLVFPRDERFGLVDRLRKFQQREVCKMEKGHA